MNFLSDGTLEFASGTQGKWKLFDATDRIFTVSFLSTRLSLKLMPGRGLVQTNESVVDRVPEAPVSLRGTVFVLRHRTSRSC